MTPIRYKGFSILTRLYQICQSKRWTVDLEIRRDGQRQSFSTDERYQTEPEAEARCASLGRRIIDGRVPGCSVDRLRTVGPGPLRRVILAGIFSFGLGTSLLIAEGSRQVDGMAHDVRIATRDAARSALDQTWGVMRRAFTMAGTTTESLRR